MASNTPLTLPVLGIDIGGTSIKAAPVETTTGATLLLPVQVPLPTPPAPDLVCVAIAGIIKDFEWSGPVGCGYPGVVKNGVALSGAHLSEAWLGVDVENRLSELTDSPVKVLNDADAAGLAEMHFGAGKERNHAAGGSVVVITLGTGIGSALFHNGRLFPNSEFGHVYMAEGIEGEELASGAVRMVERLSWEQWGDRVSRYLEEVNKLLSPDLIIIGGGVSENFDRFRHRLRVAVETVPAKMGNSAGIVGAALALTLVPSNSDPKNARTGLA